MVESLSENVIDCNFHSLNRFGFKFTEKNWYFGKYKISYFVLFGLWLYAIKCWLSAFYNEPKTDEVVSNVVFDLNASIVLSSYILKLMLFMRKNESIYNLMEVIKVDLIVVDNLDKRLENDQKFILKMTKYIYRFFNVFGFFWAIYFLGSGFFFKFYTLFYNEYNLPVIITIIEYNYELLSMLTMLYLLIDLHTVPISAMILLRSKLDVLCDEFKNLEYHSEEQFHNDISKLIEYHASLKKIKDLLCDALALPLFFELLTLSSLVAILTLNFIHVSFVLNTYEAMILTMGIIWFLMQIFLPCYYGNKVATASDNLVFSLYNCPWFEMPIKARKMIIIIMINSQKTMHIGISLFFRLTMEQFGNIVNSIYTLYTLFRDIQ